MQGDLALVGEYKQKIKNRVRYLEREEERMQAKMNAFRIDSVKQEEREKDK